MSVLSGKQIESLMQEEKKDSLVITPILDDAQLGPASVDLRLSTEFKVSVQTRSPILGVVEEPVETFFQETYREVGEDFILYPNQLVLASTFEYIRLPQNITGFVITRSSLTRLGLNISSIIQPGFAGTLTLQLSNLGENAIKLRTGMRLVQLVLYNVEEPAMSYRTNSASKYVSDIEPVLSGISKDKDLEMLRKLKQNN
ncbi:dCTP deaminase [Halobacillus salinarum]|uniref:dCTP deaminase n=1 Tax=Halobacillus salinarum TaxID=2932257 RepID=A0ABY4EJD4_9BACI|nr:dCTP deaminase [Halobacillus salinarum]UOQ44572.1 dCTP deaminase [Halobacillus salinarum]